MSYVTLPRLRAGFVSFFHDPQPPGPLGFFRIAAAGFLLLQAIIWYPDWLSFLGPDAWLQWEISQALTEEWSLHIGYIHEALKHLGFSEVQTVMALYWLYVICGLGLLVGWHTRTWAVLAWLCHYVIMGSIRTFTYGVDIFLHIALFYLMVMPVSKAYSIDALQGRVSTLPTWGVTLSMRVLQLHLCLVYLSAGFEKTRSIDWWSGNVIWRSFVQPDFRQFEFTWLAHYPWLAASFGWFTMILETGYSIGMWIPRVRVFWLAGIVALHVGIGLFLGLWLFGLIMIVLSVSAFGHAAYDDVKAASSRRRRRLSAVTSKLP